MTRSPKNDDPEESRLAKDVSSDRGRADADGDRFQLLVQAVTDYAIYMLTPEGRVASWNPGAERLKGYTEAEILGQHFSRFFTPEDRAAGKPATALNIAAATGRWEDEGWRVRKDGSRFWALAVLDAVWGKDGRLIGFAKVTRDMTERRRAEEALAESERRFRLLVSSVIDYALFTLDLDGNIRSWNPGAERLKGYTEQEVLGKHFSMFYPPEALAAGAPAQALEETRQKGRLEREGWRLRKDGSRFWANVVIDPIRDESGTLIGFTKITRDMSERRALQEAREQFFQAQKMESIGQLTGGVAHDFNNLLTAVSGSLTLLRKLTEDPRAVKLIDTAERAALRGAKLTQQLLAFSRQHRLEPERCNPNELIVAFEALLRHAAGERQVVELDLSPRLWFVAIDETQFQSALLNLVVNARDAMAATGGAMRIATRNAELDAAHAAALSEVEPGPYVMIAVGDSGTGMSAETRARAIEPFFTTKGAGKGSGLGLSQVYGFVRQSGGQIEIDSTLGSGTMIRLYLPRFAEAAEIDDGEPRTHAVLVTEDDPDVLVVTVETLRTLGYEVYAASSGTEALAILERERAIDVLFTDVVMPNGMDGVELGRRARRLRPELRVLLCSGYSRTAIERDRYTDFIAKPYRVEELARRLAKLEQLDPRVSSRH